MTSYTQVRVEVDPASPQPVSVWHELGTEDVRVACETSGGEPRGYEYAVPVGPDEVEVVLAAPDTRVVVVSPAAEEEDS